MLKKLALSALIATSAMAMHQGEININDKDLEAQLRLDMGQFNEVTEPDTVFVGFRYLNADKENSDYSEDPDLYEINFLMQQPVRANNALTLGIGAKFEYTDLGDEDFMALPLGLEASFLLPADGFVPIYLNGNVYFAPKVLSFKEGERYFEYKISVDAEIIDNGRITAGYRNIETKYKGAGNQDLNNAWFVGFKVAF
ncbi:MAG: YfaZ family outer membrane protein [Campylobacterota bacterium]|nr:YfaZ family outer membrane protein [Campylobacterota bacterium]